MEKKEYILQLFISLIYLNFLFKNIFLQEIQLSNFFYYTIDYIPPDLNLLFVSFFVIYFLFFIYENSGKLNFLNDKTFLLIFFLLLSGLFGLINYVNLNYLILLRLSLILFICLGVFFIFYVSKFKNFSLFLKYIIILTNIIILISFTNYHTENFKEIILFGYEVLPTNPKNQKFIFLLLNSFVLLFMIENNKNFKLNFIVWILVITNFLFLLRYANTYSFLLTILSIIYILYFKIFKFNLSKKFILGLKFLFIGTFLFYITIFLSPFPKNIIFKIIDLKIERVQYSDLKKLTKHYLLYGHHYKLKCSEVLPFGAAKPDNFINEYFRDNKHVTGYDNFYEKMLNFDCYAEEQLNLVNKTLKSFYPFIGLLSRIDQLHEYKKELSLDSSYIFFGLDPVRFDKQLNSGNFTHNSFYNILLRYGLIFTLILLYFLSNLFIRSTSFYFDIIFMIIIISQLFDDYLIGNRSELSFFIWFLLSNFYRQNKI